MAAERHARVKTLLLAALDLEPGASRERFLEAECGDDDALREEVQALLQEEAEERDGFLEIPAVLALSGSADAFSEALSGPTPMPEQFGPFRLLDKLGQGGMGTVYRAQQIEPVRRKVALKVISTSLTHRQARLRFGAECQALARLSHPNVASMYEAGTTHTGQPFVAMELVEGVPIHHYADEHTLGLRQRLELFLGVCAGVQHAHQKGILHRDLKPSNVLVAEIDGVPVPKVIDFGIAKAIDQPLVAETFLTGGQVLGSPAYMSPESALLGVERDVDTRADVYALGCLLHELLLGVRRFAEEDTGIGTLLRRIAEEEPVRLSVRWQNLEPAEQQRLATQRGVEGAALGRHLRGDLDAIVLKAMARDRERRYASVADLAADIRRHLHHEPIQARPPSLSYRTRRFLRRHAGAALAAGLLLVVTAAGVLALTAEARRARRAEEEARQALVEVQEVSDFLVALFEGSDPETAPGEDTTLREILDRGAGRLATELEEQPLVRARLLQTIGDVYLSLGLLESARERVKEALALRRAHLPPGDGKIVESLNQMGVILRRMGRYGEAEPLLRQVVAYREAAEPPDPLLLAMAHGNLGNVFWNQSRYEEAEASYQRALAIQREAFGEEHREVGATLLNLGTLYWSQQRDAEARQLLERAIHILEAALGPDHPRVNIGRGNLALVLERSGEMEAAAEIQRQVLASYERVLGPDHPQRAVPLTNLGGLATRQGAYREAEAYLRQALEIRLQTVGEDHPQTLMVQSQRADLLRREGRKGEAEALYRDILARREAVLGLEHAQVASTLYSLANLLRERGALAEAEEAVRRSLAIREASFGGEHPRVTQTRVRLAEVLLALDQPGPRAEAEVLLRETLPVSEALHGPDSDEVQRIRHLLGGTS